MCTNIYTDMSLDNFHFTKNHLHKNGVSLHISFKSSKYSLLCPKQISGFTEGGTLLDDISSFALSVQTCFFLQSSVCDCFAHNLDCSCPSPFNPTRGVVPTSSQGVSSGYKVDRSLAQVLDHLHIQNFWIRMQIQIVWLLFEIHIFVIISQFATRFNSLFVRFWLPAAGCTYEYGTLF